MLYISGYKQSDMFEACVGVTFQGNTEIQSLWYRVYTCI